MRLNLPVAEKSAGYSPRAQKVREQAVKEAEKQKAKTVFIHLVKKKSLQKKKEENMEFR